MRTDNVSLHCAKVFWPKKMPASSPIVNTNFFMFLFSFFLMFITFIFCFFTFYTCKSFYPTRILQLLKFFFVTVSCSFFVFRFVDAKLQPSTSGHLSNPINFLSTFQNFRVKAEKKQPFDVKWKKNAVFRWHENPVLAEKLSHAFSEMRKPNLNEKRRYKKKFAKKANMLEK